MGNGDHNKTMKHLLIILISFLLLPISVFGVEWTVKYDMKKSDGSYEFVELSVPIVEGLWKLPNQVGSWICGLDRRDDTKYGTSEVALQCHLKKNKPWNTLTSMIRCNTENTKSNWLGVNYPSDSKGIPSTVIILRCNL